MTDIPTDDFATEAEMNDHVLQSMGLSRGMNRDMNIWTMRVQTV